MLRQAGPRLYQFKVVPRGYALASERGGPMNYLGFASWTDLRSWAVSRCHPRHSIGVPCANGHRKLPDRLRGRTDMPGILLAYVSARDDEWSARHRPRLLERI